MRTRQVGQGTGTGTTCVPSITACPGWQLCMPEDQVSSGASGRLATGPQALAGPQSMVNDP